MKEKIHPPYHKANVKCSCGASFEVNSALEEIHVDICHICHPYYTGKTKLVDTGGRIDKFNKRYGRKK